VVSAFVKLTSYAQGGVVTRRDGTQGFEFRVNASGQVQLVGYNAALANYKLLSSYQSIPLNKWVHIAAQQDMSSATNSPTVNYIMIDGKDVPAVVTSGGTAPTTLVQAGNLTVGATNGAEFFPGQIAQAALYSAKVTQATILASMNQTLTGSETSIISAWKLDQASGLNDLSANANNLTAQGSPSYSTTQTPFTNSVTGTSVTAGTTNYGIIMAQTFSTNTTYTIQIPEGETLPTTGGIGTVSYSTQKTPYGFPGQRGKWDLFTRLNIDTAKGTATGGTWYNNSGTSDALKLNVPVGTWSLGYSCTFGGYDAGVTSVGDMKITLSTANNTESDTMFTSFASIEAPSGTIGMRASVYRKNSVTLSAAADYYLNVTSSTTVDDLRIYGTKSPTLIFIENELL
jgi:hypothetical protein